MDESIASEPRWVRWRRWARRCTLTLVFLPMLLAAPSFASCVAHAMVDSEVGVMTHGFPIIFGVVLLLPLVLTSTIVWGLGLRKARLGGDDTPFWERWLFRGIATVLALLVWGFSLDFIHRGLQWVGLR
jgi:hypothetical protein